MANSFIPMLDRQMWVQVPPAPNAHAAGGSLASDLRNDSSAQPYITQLVSNTVWNKYHKVQKSWGLVGSMALATTFGAGAWHGYAPSRGLFGTVAAGCSTTSIVISTAFPSAVGVNQLANKGDGVGFRIRITGNAGAGSSGKIEERTIVANTGGTTPTIILDEALSFTPASGDAYDVLAGRFFFLGASTLAAASWRSFESACNYALSLGTTNLPGTIGTDSAGVALDELYVPYDHKPGEGFVIGAGTYDTGGAATSKYCLTATATAAGTLTGQASGGDVAVLQNEYRNFQIRIVEDTGTPAAVGQRRIIASHTAGASPVYTLGSAWATQPSATAKYVIELPNLLLLQSTASTSWFTYNYSGATVNNGTNSINSNAWSVTYFAACTNAHGAGVCLFPSFGIEPDSAKNARHSFVYRLRGGGSSAVDVFDIAGGATGAWTEGIVVDGAVSITTGSCGKIAPFANEGRYGYFNSYVASQVNQIYRFDVKNRAICPLTPTDWIQSGTAAAGDRIGLFNIINGTDKYTGILLLSHTATNAFELIVQV